MILSSWIQISTVFHHIVAREHVSTSDSQFTHDHEDLSEEVCKSEFGEVLDLKQERIPGRSAERFSRYCLIGIS